VLFAKQGNEINTLPMIGQYLDLKRDPPLTESTPKYRTRTRDRPTGFVL
jgi:hypothetical protein